MEKNLKTIIRKFSEERKVLQEKNANVVTEVKADSMVRPSRSCQVPAPQFLELERKEV